jgi:hypothetical protein
MVEYQKQGQYTRTNSIPHSQYAGRPAPRMSTSSIYGGLQYQQQQPYQQTGRLSVRPAIRTVADARQPVNFTNRVGVPRSGDVRPSRRSDIKVDKGDPEVSEFTMEAAPLRKVDGLEILSTSKIKPSGAMYLEVDNSVDEVLEKMDEIYTNMPHHVIKCYENVNMVVHNVTAKDMKIFISNIPKSSDNETFLDVVNHLITEPEDFNYVTISEFLLKQVNARLSGGAIKAFLSKYTRGQVKELTLSSLGEIKSLMLGEGVNTGNPTVDKALVQMSNDVDFIVEWNLLLSTVISEIQRATNITKLDERSTSIQLKKIVILTTVEVGDVINKLVNKDVVGCALNKNTFLYKCIHTLVGSHNEIKLYINKNNLIKYMTKSCVTPPELVIKKI